MSSNPSPNRSTPNSYENYYDPSFTAEISSKMHVPDKICVIEGIAPPQAFSNHPDDVKTKMNVPERIIVAGDNKHIAMRESMPELKFDHPFPYQFSNLVLSSPPDVLTVDEYPYHAEEVIPAKETKKKSVSDQGLNETIDLNESTLSVSASPAEEVAMLRRQFRHLSRRLLTLEQEHQQMRQRELIFCTVGLAYLVLKGLGWIHRHI